MLILNGSVVNSSVLRIGNTFYRLIIVRLVGENRLYFMPKKVKVGNIEVEMLPRNKSVTYTGMLPYEYAMKFDGKTCRVVFWLGPIDANPSNPLTAWIRSPCPGVYTVKIVIAKPYVDTWLVLVKQSTVR